MPMCDLFIPPGALSQGAERELVAKLTDQLLEHEGADPSNPRARELAWVFVHRHEMYVGGQRAQAPHYRIVCSVPEGQYNDDRRAAMTQAVAGAEAGSHPDPEGRVWVFTQEVPDGWWGGLGRVTRLPDIYEHVVGEPGRAVAEQVLAKRRRRSAQRILNAASEPAGTGAS